MKLEIKEFESDFEVLHQFLIGEQVLLLHQLEERYESLLARQSSNISQLEEQSAALSRLIAEAEDKSKQDGLQLLKVWLVGWLFWGFFFSPYPWDGKGESWDQGSQEEGRALLPCQARPLPDVFELSKRAVSSDDSRSRSLDCEPSLSSAPAAVGTLAPLYGEEITLAVGIKQSCQEGSGWTLLQKGWSSWENGLTWRAGSFPIPPARDPATSAGSEGENGKRRGGPEGFGVC